MAYTLLLLWLWMARGINSIDSNWHLMQSDYWVKARFPPLSKKKKKCKTAEKFDKHGRLDNSTTLQGFLLKKHTAPLRHGLATAWLLFYFPFNSSFISKGTRGELSNFRTEHSNNILSLSLSLTSSLQAPIETTTGTIPVELSVAFHK